MCKLRHVNRHICALLAAFHHSIFILSLTDSVLLAFVLFMALNSSEEVPAETQKRMKIFPLLDFFRNIQSS